MPKYYFLYHNERSRGVVFQSDYDANTEKEARKYIAGHYNADLVAIRKGRKFSDAEIREKKNSLRYGK